MAILTGINSRLKGSAGDWTFAQVGGKTVAKQKMAKKDNPRRTQAQMQRRCLWANLVNLYRAFDGNLKPSFEGKPAGCSHFNMFMAANIGTSNIYLPKAVAKNGGTVVGPYQITRGSLPSIDVVLGTGQQARTSIDLGSLVLDPNTTLKAFSQAVVQHNPDFRYGDQISAFVATQRVNSVTAMPEVGIKCFEVTLDVVDEQTKLYDIVNSFAFSVVDGHLGAAAPIDGAIAWVHSRQSNGSVQVSTQRFCVSSSMVADYTTPEAMISAIDSYGGELSPDFLVPNVGSGIQQGASGSQPSVPDVTPSTFTLNVVSSPANGGSVTGGGSYAQGAQATLRATPASGYTFARWNDGSTQNPRTVTVTESTTYTATFTASGGSTPGNGGTEEG